MNRTQLVASFALLLAPATTSLADGGLRTVALSGNQAPGAGPGVNFNGFGNLVLNDAGQTAFGGSLTGAGVTGANNGGIYREEAGALAEVARRGNQAPGAGPGVNFNNFGNLVLNDAGQTAFPGFLTGAGVTGANNSGIYREEAGALTEVAREGNQAPGAGPGVNFSSFAASRLNNAGQTAFNGSLTGAGVTGANNSGIYREGAGTLEEIAREGNQAPGAGPGVNFNGFGNLVLNDAGQTAFFGLLSGVGVTLSNDRGIYREGAGTLEEVAREGNQAPGAPSGANFIGFGFVPVLNDMGQTAFTGFLTGAGVTFSNDLGIYRERAGTLEEVAREGNQAPGAGPGVNFRGFGNLVLNDAGQIAFRGGLTGAGVTSSNDIGIYSEGNGALAEVARAGNQAPGAGPGVNFNNFGNLALNDAGQTAFRGSLTGTGVTDSNDTGIWAEDLAGDLRLIARTGDLLDVDDDPLVDDLRTIWSLSFLGITGNGDGRPSTFNNLGQLAFAARFTDGSSGVFVSNVAAIPEPSALLLTLLATTGLLRRRR